MHKINRNPEWNDRPAGTFDFHSCIAGFVWCKFWMSIANYLEHFIEQPCSRNFENLLLIFGDTDRRGWYFLFVFVESDPWTCIVYKLGFSYVNDILWKIFFDSFLRSDWIQKKNTFAREQYCLVFMPSMVPWKDCGSKSRLSRKKKTELCERKVQQGSRDNDRLTSAPECILNKAFLSIT